MTREKKIEKIAKVWLSRMDLKSLEQFYYDNTLEYFNYADDEDIEIEYLDAIE